MIELQSKSLPNEAMDFFGHTIKSPSASAFVQQRDKFLPESWEYLFHLFVQDCHSIQNRLYRGKYRLLACDGSDVNIARNPSDEDTFIHEGKRAIMPYTSIPCSTWKTAHTMMLLSREKRKTSNGILAAYDLPDDEFDMRIQTTLTYRHTKETLNNPNIYTILPKSTDFDFMDENCPYYEIGFRIVRFRVDDGKYICVATNLPEDEFPLEEIKKLYKRRWSQKTSFRELKYTIGLINWHSRKSSGIIQEMSG